MHILFSRKSNSESMYLCITEVRKHNLICACAMFRLHSINVFWAQLSVIAFIRPLIWDSINKPNDVSVWLVNQRRGQKVLLLQLSGWHFVIFHVMQFNVYLFIYAIFFCRSFIKSWHKSSNSKYKILETGSWIDLILGMNLRHTGAQ